MSSGSSAGGTSQTIVVQTATSKWWGRIGWLGFLVCAAILAAQIGMRQDYLDDSGGIRERLRSGPPSARSKVAIVNLAGVITHGDGYVKKQIDRIRKDPQVRAVVLRIDSPGGTVAGSDYLHYHLTKLREERNLPIVVSMGSIATSGGYYVAMAAGPGQDLVLAEPTTTTGSIGVIIPHYDLSGLLDEFNIRDDSISSHAWKQMLSMTREMDNDEREILQSYVDYAFERFKRIIRETRPELGAEAGQLVAIDTGQDLATGQIFTAEQALQHGLIDRIGFLEDAVARAVELAELNPDRVRVVEYQRPVSLASLVGLPTVQERGGPSSWNVPSLWDVTVPQAYYLLTTVPPLVRSELIP